jgi:hypothetical protein
MWRVVERVVTDVSKNGSAFETSTTTHSTRHTPEDNIQQHWCENLRYHKLQFTDMTLLIIRFSLIF